VPCQADLRERVHAERADGDDQAQQREGRQRLETEPALLPGRQNIAYHIRAVVSLTNTTFPASGKITESVQFGQYGELSGRAGCALPSGRAFDGRPWHRQP